MLRQIFTASKFGRKLTFKPSVTQQRNLQGLVIGVPKESHEGEARVALTPVNVVKLVKSGAAVHIEKNAGIGSGFSNEQYLQAGAQIVSGEEAWKAAVVTKIRPPTEFEAVKIENRSIVSIIQPRVNTKLMEQLIAQKATVFSLDSLLRTLSRGQSFDVLSSQANVAGARAVIEATHFLQRPFAGQMTAAGRILHFPLLSPKLTVIFLFNFLR
jgi:NAD(P) transhydrogenase